LFAPARACHRHQLGIGNIDHAFICNIHLLC
jgi:hypothetical protein